MVVKRSHTNANIAPIIKRLREQIDGAHPNRPKASDGIWPSAAHTKANPKSDHEAGNALDITAAPWLEGVISAIVSSKDPRIKYIIYRDRIWSPEGGWRGYGGSNPHNTHAHFSVKEERRAHLGDWRITKRPRAYPGVVIAPGMKGADVRWIQRRLNHHGFSIAVDGQFGYWDAKRKKFVGGETGAAVKRFREREFRARPQGMKVGPKTWERLGRSAT